MPSVDPKDDGKGQADKTKGSEVAERKRIAEENAWRNFKLRALEQFHEKNKTAKADEIAFDILTELASLVRDSAPRHEQEVSLDLKKLSQHQKRLESLVLAAKTKAESTGGQEFLEHLSSGGSLTWYYNKSLRGNGEAGTLGLGVLAYGAYCPADEERQQTTRKRNAHRPAEDAFTPVPPHSPAD